MYTNSSRGTFCWGCNFVISSRGTFCWGCNFVISSRGTFCWGCNFGGVWCRPTFYFVLALHVRVTIIDSGLCLCNDVKFPLCVVYRQYTMPFAQCYNCFSYVLSEIYLTLSVTVQIRNPFSALCTENYTYNGRVIPWWEQYVMFCLPFA